MNEPTAGCPRPEGSRAIAISGERVALGTLRRDLIPLYQRWFGDFEVGAPYFLGTLVPETSEGAEERYERYTRLPGAARAVAFTIYERATMRPIGTTNLSEIDHYNRTASFGISIGEKDCWGKGYGTEATRLMLDYAFTLLGLHAVHLTVFEYNERAIRAYRRAGFQPVGRWREAKRFAGRAYDVICMDCLATEFERPATSSLRRIVPAE